MGTFRFFFCINKEISSSSFLRA
jgi:hypothetical protein